MYVCTYIYTTIFMWDQPYTLCNYLKFCLGMWASGNECRLSFGGGYSYGIMHGLCNKPSPVCHCGSHIAVEWMSFLFAAMTLTVLDHLIFKKWCATLQLGFYLSIFFGVAVARNPHFHQMMGICWSILEVFFHPSARWTASWLPEKAERSPIWLKRQPDRITEQRQGPR